ncbi:MAG: phosphoribosylaminoimidazolesuccinocarboxamide synthase [Alphaproteobacteria bacterium]
MSSTLFHSNIQSLKMLNRGKVRDIYAAGDDHLLIVTSDRLSAFDVVLPTAIPGKGRVLTELSNFWFGRTGELVKNHLSDRPLEDVVTDAADRAALDGRATVVHRYEPLPIEAIVRGYIVGSGWKDYQASGTVCGIALPEGLRQADKLAEPLFTPSTKAELGGHDENISFDEAAALLGTDVADRVREAALAVYCHARDYAETKGIIVADTKFEFALDSDGELVLIDEVVTPDSSRFWPADEYAPGQSPPSFDKQFVRDYLESIGWDKKPPGLELPEEIAAKTAAKYREAQARLTE